MNHEQLTAALTDLRDTVGRHMNRLDQMGRRSRRRPSGPT